MNRISVWFKDFYRVRVTPLIEKYRQLLVQIDTWWENHELEAFDADKQINIRLFVFGVGLFTLLGFGGAQVIALWRTQLDIDFLPYLWLAVGFLVAVIGYVTTEARHEWPISAAGYILVLGGSGFVIGSASKYQILFGENAQLTYYLIVITFVLWVVAFVSPKEFQGSRIYGIYGLTWLVTMFRLPWLAEQFGFSISNPTPIDALTITTVSFVGVLMNWQKAIEKGPSSWDGMFDTAARTFREMFNVRLRKRVGFSIIVKGHNGEESHVECPVCKARAHNPDYDEDW